MNIDVVNKDEAVKKVFHGVFAKGVCHCCKKHDKIDNVIVKDPKEFVLHDTYVCTRCNICLAFEKHIIN